VGAVLSGYEGGVVHYLPTPFRVLDAAGFSSGVQNRGPLTANEVYAFQVSGQSHGGSTIASGALGLICNVTVLGAGANGNLSMFPADAASIPVTASITFSAGQYIANGVQSGLGAPGGSAPGQVKIQNQSAAPLHVVVDVVGFVL
jgi:hypothetical protein